MPRQNDPLRMLTARLIGAAWRTAVHDEVQALGELRTIAVKTPRLLPQASADAARFWVGRADEGMVDIDRAKTAADRLRQLAVDEHGHEVAPSPRERNVTVHRGWKGA